LYLLLLLLRRLQPLSAWQASCDSSNSLRRSHGPSA
jgi:hypothetical protein